MHCASVMVGYLRVFYPSVFVAVDLLFDHAMNCSSGGFPTIRHNKLMDFTTTVLSEVYHDVAIEPVLQRLTGENFHYATAKLM